MALNGKHSSHTGCTSYREVYQSGIRSRSLKAMQSLPSPEKYVWIKVADSWTPLWTLLPEAAKAYRELLKCGCKAEPAKGPRSGGFRSPSGAGAACGERQVAGRMGPSETFVFHPLATRCCHRMRQGARGRPAVPYSYKELNHCKHISSAGWPHPGG